MGKQILFKDLLRIFKKNIIKIIIITVVFALFMGSYSYISQIQTETSFEGISDSEKYENEVYLKKVKDFEDWWDTGLYLHIDAANAPVYENVVLIESNAVESDGFDYKQIRDETIASYFEFSLQRNQVKQEAYERLNDKIDINLLDLNYIFSSKVVTGTSVVWITVISDNHANSKLISDTLLDVTADYVGSAYEDFEITVIASDSYFETIESTFETQKNLINEYESNKGVLEAAKFVSGDDDSDKNNFSIKNLIIFFILGALIGFALIFVILVLIDVNRKSPLEIRDINARYNIRVLGCINIGEVDLNADNNLVNEQLEKISKALKVLSRNKRVLVTGSIEQEDFDRVSSAISSIYNVDFLSGGCILDNINTLDKLYEADTVVLLEQLGKSRYDRMNEQIITIEGLGKEISSFVIIK